MASAAPGKKKGRKKGVSVDLNVFLADKGAQDGKVVTIVKTGDSWADQMDSFDREEKTVVLPTAPSSVRGGMNVDPDRIPVNGPFKVFIANVSYDADEEMVASMFRGLDVVGVHLPTDGGGRFKGFGYVEFGNRDDLIEALQMDDLEVGGRKLRIDLKTPNERDQQRGFSSSYRPDADPDRAESDWRSGPREPARTDNRDRDWRSGGGGGGGGGGGFSDRGGYGGFGSRDREPREPTMATKPGSKYEAVPSFADYARGGGGGGGGGRDSYDRRGDDRFGGRDDRYGDRDRGGGGGGYGYDRDRRDDRDRGGYGNDRRDERYGSRDDRYSNRGYGDRDGPRYDSRDGPRYDSRDGPRYDSRDGPRDGPRYDSRDGPRYDSRDGPRDGPRYESRDGPRDGPRYESRDGPRDGPRYESRDGPRSGSGDRSDEPERAPAERPKLNLKPRSVPADDIGKPAASSSIFGGAKPVDTTAREREVEERLKASQPSERPRPAPADGPPSGSQRRAEASRDIRLSEPRQSRDEQPSSGSRETNGKAEEKKPREPRPPKVLEEKSADFAEPSRFSALAIDDDDGDDDA